MAGYTVAFNPRNGNFCGSIFLASETKIIKGTRCACASFTALLGCLQLLVVEVEICADESLFASNSETRFAKVSTLTARYCERPNTTVQLVQVCLVRWIVSVYKVNIAQPPKLYCNIGLPAATSRRRINLCVQRFVCHQPWNMFRISLNFVGYQLRATQKRLAYGVFQLSIRHTRVTTSKQNLCKGVFSSVWSFKENTGSSYLQDLFLKLVL